MNRKVQHNLTQHAKLRRK